MSNERPGRCPFGLATGRGGLMGPIFATSFLAGALKVG